MSNTLRGRPPLNIPLREILEVVRRHQNVMAAARELGCSDAYIHVRFKKAGLTLREVLEAGTVQGLLQSAHPRQASKRSGSS